MGRWCCLMKVPGGVLNSFNKDSFYKLGSASARYSIARVYLCSCTAKSSLDALW